MSVDIGNLQLLGAREDQQDYFAVFSVHEVMVALVADGMGGHVGGALASEAATRAFRRTVEEAGELIRDWPGAALRDAVQAANSAIRDIVERDPAMAGMGTTLVACAVLPAQLCWISIGDSPMYGLDENGLQRMNVDHSYARELDQAVARGDISAAMAASSPERHLVTSVLTGDPIPEIDGPHVATLPALPDRLLLASDGIHTVPEAELASLLADSASAAQAADLLGEAIEQAARPGQDNSTAIVLFLGGH